YVVVHWFVSFVTVGGHSDARDKTADLLTSMLKWCGLECVQQSDRSGCQAQKRPVSEACGQPSSRTESGFSRLRRELFYTLLESDLSPLPYSTQGEEKCSR